MKFKEVEFYDLGNGGMEPDFEYVFHPFNDSLKFSGKEIYNLSILIRYNKFFSHGSLPLNIEYASLNNDSIKNKHINIPLFEEKNIIGKGNYGIYETEFPLLTGINKEEGFFVSISTPQSETDGIISLGVMLTK